jgi:hypothetical protein
VAIREALLSATSVSGWTLKLKALSENPKPSDCPKITGSKHDWRIRIGDYRVISSSISLSGGVGLFCSFSIENSETKGFETYIVLLDNLWIGGSQTDA